MSQSHFSLEEQLERQMAGMKYLLDRASIAQRYKDYEQAKGFMKVLHKSFHEAMDLQAKIEVSHQLEQFAEEMKAQGVQAHHLMYRVNK
ncbi:hypothetical protein ACTWQB_11450 [Piscibacillus sp. B03]|uniref:hypothetical protein n=1 Tax=Piscibacillus sp. B03 TaxID=3457430 RepID=UPI003FCDBA0C